MTTVVPRAHGAPERSGAAGRAHRDGRAHPDRVHQRAWDIPVAIRTIKAGAVDFVQKPYQQQQLLDSINEAPRGGARRARALSLNLEGTTE